MSKEKFLIEFGKHIRALRKEHGLTSSELGHKMEIERFHVSRLENGKVNPTLTTIKRLARSFDMEVSEFMQGFTEEL